MSSLVLVSAIALAFFDLGFRMLADVLAERSADVVAFVELPPFRRVARTVCHGRCRSARGRLNVFYLAQNYLSLFVDIAFPALSFSLSKASSNSCLLLNTGAKRSPFFFNLSRIFLIVKSLVETFLSFTSFHSSGVETVAPGFGLTEYGATTDLP